MTSLTPSRAGGGLTALDYALHTAGALAFAAEEFSHGSPARQAFVPTLELWAANARARAEALQPARPDLFSVRSDSHVC